jgi:hypothetical protein
MLQTVENADSARTTARLWQPLMCGLLLLAILASSLLVHTGANSEALGIWVDERRAAIKETSLVEFARQYLDTEDRLVLDEIPKLDCSDGGVYFFGASNMKWATRTLELPSNERRLIHNLGCGEGSPAFQLQFFDYLVRHRDLLKAGPEKTLVVYGTSLLNIPPAKDRPGAFFPNLWRRYGLYRYDLATGIHPTAVSPLAEKYYLEKARCSSFVQASMDLFCRSFVPKSLRRRLETKDPAVIAKNYQTRLGSRWQESMAKHKVELEHFVDSIQQRHVKVVIVLLPLASWHQPLPYTSPYAKLVRDLCTAKSVPLVDLTAALADGDFEDHIHANERGVNILDPILMQLARDHLRHVGALPSEKP